MCRFDDGDIRTYSRKVMTTMMATKFPKLRNMRELDSKTSADVEESEADIRESDSEEEKLEILSRKKRERANEQS